MSSYGPTIQPNERILVVGGTGFVGWTLATALVSSQSSASAPVKVAIVDVVAPKFPLGDNMQFHKADITHEAAIVDVFEAFRPTVVVVVASWGMSGAGMLEKACLHINVAGIQNVVAACCKCNISRLIYTSTYNVVFCGKPIRNGDESMKHAEIGDQVDYYSASKTMADKLVLQANDTKLSNGGYLKVAIIRPAAIYGESEQRHFPRIVGLMDLGLFVFRVFPNALCDWVYIDNLIQAYWKIIVKLIATDEKTSSAVYPFCGQAYFICDGAPVESFEMFRPLLQARGVAFPTLRIPVGLLRSFGFVCELLYHATKKIGFPIEPFMTRAEVNKVGVTHYFKIDKAKRDFGYDPRVTTPEGMLRIAAYYSKPLPNETNQYFFKIIHPLWWFLVFLGMWLLYECAYTADMAARHYSLQLVNQFALAIFQTQATLQYVFVVAVGLHVAEGLIALGLSAYMGCSAAMVLLWTVQTSCLGYFSLGALVARFQWFYNKAKTAV